MLGVIESRCLPICVLLNEHNSRWFFNANAIKSGNLYIFVSVTDKLVAIWTNKTDVKMIAVVNEKLMQKVAKQP